MTEPCLDDQILLELTGGRLTASGQLVVDAHLDQCAACRVLLASLARAAVPEIERTVGRYLLLKRIGRGGLGEVWAAYDPELDRKVAVKLLRAELEDDAWLVKEAQAMARITHPNVLGVHDVGRAGERMFVAMEYVSGGTLRAWHQARARSWREVVAVGLAAARGLAAAHAAGIVHRDFKPDNVLLDGNGRVVVSDFGPPGVGTPAYVAPEQRAGEPATTYSDQYAFCLVMRNLLASPSSGALACPGRIRSVVSRGLAQDPAGRHRSMDELVAELERAVRRRWRWYAAGAALGLMAVVGATVARQDAPEICGPPTERLVGVWDGPRRVQLAAALVATGKSYARVASQQIAAELDAYTGGWLAAHVEACRASHVRHEQSGERLDRRMQCLEQRRLELTKLVEVLERGDVTSVAQGADTVRALVPVTRCSDVQTLAARVEPPADLVTRTRVDALQRRMASVRAGLAAGLYRDTLPDARAVVADARALAYGPVLAEAELVLGTLELRHGEYVAARRTLEQAARIATSVYDHETAADAWIGLIEVIGAALKDLDAADQATAWAQSLLGPDAAPRSRASLLSARSNLEVLRGDFRAAESSLHEALAIYEASRGKDDRLVARTLDRLGVAISRQDRTAEARALHHRALDLRDRTLGSSHPDRADSLERLGLLASNEGHHDEAIELLRQAVSIRRAGLGSGDPLTAVALNNLGVALRRSHRDREALATLREALAVREQALGPDHPDVARTLQNIGTTLGSMGQCREALEIHERVRAIAERVYGPEHGDVADSLSNEATALTCMERPREAIEAYRRALAIYEARLGRSSARVGFVLSALGQAYLARAQPGEAVRVLERAKAIVDGSPRMDPVRRVAVDFRLAEALWADAVARGGRDRAALDRARKLAEAARRVHSTIPTADPDDVKAIDAWLAARR